MVPVRPGPGYSEFPTLDLGTRDLERAHLRAAPVHSSMGVDLRARAEAGAQSSAAAGRRRARGRAELPPGLVGWPCR